MAEYQPFGITEIAVPPSDLESRLDKMESIIRFIDSRYPEGVFEDNDKLHTERLATIAAMDAIRGVNKVRLIREVWIHDVPELITGDIVSPTKEKMEESGDTKFIDEEDEAAQKILSPEDLALYRDFVSSGNFLKGKSKDVSKVTPEGLVAYVIDKIDGNMYFHCCMSEWFNTDDGKPKDASEVSLIYCFNQANKFNESLSKIENLFPEAVATCRFLLNYQLTFIVDTWHKVDQPKRPEVVNRELHKISEI